MKKLILPFSLLLILSACNEQDQRKATIEKEEDSHKEVLEDKYQKREYYPIPSPEQMFSFINDNGIAYNKSLVHDYKAADNYQHPIKKALVFGIYTADLAYTAAYQDVESTVNLYETVRKLSLELNVEELMTEDMMQKIQANMENPDSLTLIAADSYYRAIEYLESNGEEGKLSLMSLGAWIESIHIALGALKDIDLGSSTIQRIAAQKITFENLYTYLSINRDKLGVEAELNKLQRIKAVFDSLQKGSSAKSTTQKGEKLIFGQGNKIKMTMEQFLELKSAIEVYRSQLVTQNK